MARPARVTSASGGRATGGGRTAARGKSAGAAKDPRYPIESVDHALKLLMWLRERSSISVAQAGDYLDVARSTAHRMLAMLQHHGLVQQEPVLKTYVPGPALVELGLAALRDIDIRAQVQPYLEALVAEVGETAHLVARKGRSVIFLDCVECDKAVRAGSRSGQMLLAHCTASGKALLAALDDEALAQLYPEGKLPALTARSITTRAQLLRQVAEIRRRGHAINKGESEAGLSAVAAVLRDAGGKPVGAITVAGPSFRVGGESLARIAESVTRCAAAVGTNLPHPLGRRLQPAALGAAQPRWRALAPW